MALQDIIQEIQKKAEEKITHLQAEHDRTIKALKEDYLRKESTEKESIDKKVEQNIIRLNKQAETMVKMHGKNSLLKAKRELIDKTFAQATEELSDSPDYEAIITALLKSSDAPSSAEVIPAKGKEQVTAHALQKSGKSYRLATEDNPKIKGGFIITSEKINIDYSFSSMIKNLVQPEIEDKVINLLF